jgi:acyl carrier protein
MTDDEQKVIAAIQTLLGREVEITASTSLRDGLGLDSNALVELTVLVHTMYRVDLGRRAAERKVIPETVSDVAALLATP